MRLYNEGVEPNYSDMLKNTNAIAPFIGFFCIFESL